MDSYEKWGYSLLAIIAVIYLIAMIAGMIAASPYGLQGLFFIAGPGILMTRVLSIVVLPDKCNILLQETISNKGL